VKNSLWPAILILLGLALLGLSFCVDVVAPASARWTEEDGAKRQKASADFHAANYDLPQADDSSAPDSAKRPDYDPVAAKAKYQAAKQEYERQTARLAGAQSSPVWLMWGARMLGALLAVIGVAGHLQARRSSKQ
jgi:cobalamin biosynthesis Mg chelatase CobN